jgi:hypothetical protein
MKISIGRMFFFSVLFSLMFTRLPLAIGAEVNVRDFGAVGDGQADDRASFAAALASLGGSGGGTLVVPPGSYRIVATETNVCLGVQDGITVRGTKGASRLILESDQPGQYRELLRVAGNQIALESLYLTRRGALSGILIKVYPVTGLSLRAVTIDGAGGLYGRGVHGLEIAAQPGGNSRDLRLDDCEVTGVDYGLFMTNDSTATLREFVATGCRFRGNWSDDLGFNAPKGGMSAITLVGCTFSGNNSLGSDSGGGFALSLSNVRGASIVGCHFSGYQADAIHIEDQTRNVTISGGCTFVGCATNGYAVINLINDSHAVTISGNHFDGTGSARAVPCVLVTTGGQQFPSAGDVVVSGNTMDLGSSALGVVAYSAPRVVITENIIQGAGPTGANYGVDVRNAGWAVVTNNVLRGLGCASVHGGIVDAHDSIITGNVVAECGAPGM